MIPRVYVDAATTLRAVHQRQAVDARRIAEEVRGEVVAIRVAVGQHARARREVALRAVALPVDVRFRPWRACRHAPAWIRPLIEWCAEHDGIARPDVPSLATTCNMRRETLARLCHMRGVCPPNHIISWVLVVRARARMVTPRHTLADIAHGLGLASAGSLANLIQRRTGQTATKVRTLTLDQIAERAPQACSAGSTTGRLPSARPTTPPDRSRANVGTCFDHARASWSQNVWCASRLVLALAV